MRSWTRLLPLFALLGIVGVWTQFCHPRPTPKEAPQDFSVHGVSLGMTLEEIRANFEPQYRLLFKGRGEYELRGGPYGGYRMRTLVMVH